MSSTPLRFNGKCNQEGCTIEQDGKCLEGLEPSQCPHFTETKIENAETPVAKKTESGTEDSIVVLPKGADLNPQSAAAISRSALTKLVLIAGEVGSGKTTLLASIYEKFNEGPFADHLFSGSETLPGWERRCHLARVASESVTPDTERTLGLDQTLLHLRVRHQQLTEPIQDVLLTDISGELFRRIRDSSEECRRVPILKRADCFVLTLDGEQLSQEKNRHDVFHSGTLILRSCCDEGMLGDHSVVDVVFTKYDRFKMLEENDANTKAFFEHVQNTISDRFAHRFGQLRFHKIAARSDIQEVEDAFGVAPLFHSWIRERLNALGDVPHRVSRSSLDRQFDHFLWKRLPWLAPSE